MAQILIIFILLVLTFLLFGKPISTQNNNSPKQIIQRYLSEFNMYLCLKNKLILFPPKELSINKVYFTLNLTTNNDLLPHKCINAGSVSRDITACTECLHHCPLGSPDMVDLKLSFNVFRTLSDEELKAHIKTLVSQEEFEKLFEEE